MLLQRYYDRPEGWEPQYEGLDAFAASLTNAGLTSLQQEAQIANFRRGARVLNQPKMIGVNVIHTGTNPEQNWSRDWVETGVANGWFSLSQGVITLHTQTQGDFVYTIVHTPGTYCCHCQERLDDDPSGVSSREHVTLAHGDTPSPDPSNPAGYRVTNAYECRLDEAQHAQFNYQQLVAARRAGQSTIGPSVTPAGRPSPAQRQRAASNGARQEADKEE